MGRKDGRRPRVAPKIIEFPKCQRGILICSRHFLVGPKTVKFRENCCHWLLISMQNVCVPKSVQKTLFLRESKGGDIVTRTSNASPTLNWCLRKLARASCQVLGPWLGVLYTFFNGLPSLFLSFFPSQLDCNVGTERVTIHFGETLI